MLDAGVDVNSYDTSDTRNSPLHWAACYGTKDIVKFLIGKKNFCITDI